MPRNKPVLPLCIAALLLAGLLGCSGKEASPSGPEPLPESPPQSEQAQPEAAPTLASLLDAQGIELPPAMLEAVEANADAQLINPTLQVRLLEWEDCAVVELSSMGEAYSHPQEFHVFVDGEYRGAIPCNATYEEVEQPFFAFGDWLWLITEQSAGHGTGLLRVQRVWYEISDPALPESLRFTSYLGSGQPYPGVVTVYRGEMIEHTTETQLHTGEEMLLLVLSWSEAFSTGLGAEREAELFTASGVVLYSYFGESHSFYRRYEGAVDNSVHDRTDTDSGRDGRDLLFTYADELAELARSGDEAQRQWLRDFLGQFSELADITALAQWLEEFEEG